ncbi:MAG: hypothetical protein ACREMN_01325 [Gemmatimonadales bacterium]
MRVLIGILCLLALPLASSAAQGQRRDPCTLPDGGVRRGAPAQARDRAQTSGQGQKSGLNQDRSLSCEVPESPPPPAPPASGSAEIRGASFADNDFSFTWSSGEPGLSGWIIELNGPVSGRASTDGNGGFSFASLPGGIYTVCQQPQLSWWQTLPMEGANCASGMVGYIVVIPEGSASRFEGHDFGNAPITQ